MSKEERLRELEKTEEFKKASIALGLLILQSFYCFSMFVGWFIFEAKLLLFLFITSIPVLLVIFIYCKLKFKSLKSEIEEYK